MRGFKCNICLIILLVSPCSIPAKSQQINKHDSLLIFNSYQVNLQPRMHYSLGSTFMIVPHMGSVTGVTISPFLSLPLSPKLSVEGGIVAGHYFALGNVNHEGAITGAFNELTLFSSATYHVNSQLTLYGAGMKQLTSTSPYYFRPKSSYAIGSSYKFENFSIGISVQMSKWNNNYSFLPFNGTQGFYSPFEQRPGIWP